MIFNEKEFIWVEKYRPQRIDDLILDDKIKSRLKEFLNTQSNLLFSSRTPGLGKTSIANAIIKEGGFESLFLNASLEKGIDVLRGSVASFASTSSFNGKKKIVILDEIDNMTEQAQSALRGFIEEFSINCCFIATCNYINKIIEPVRNRFEIFDFDKMVFDTQSNVKEIYERLEFILKNEKIEYDNSNILQIIKENYPSIRGCIMSLQRNCVNGKLQYNVFDNENAYQKIIELAQSKNIQEMLKIIYEITNPSGFYSYVFNNIRNYKNIPQMIVVLAKYQEYDSKVRDKNLNLGACLIELAPVL